MINTNRLLLLIVCLTTILSGKTIAQDSQEAWVTGLGVPMYFAVLVEDVDKAVDWYGLVFGLKELDGSQADNGSWRIVNLGNDTLSVEIIRDDRAQDVNRAQGFFKLGFKVPDVNLIAERVAKTTGESPKVVDDLAHGVQILQLRDPEGNIIQLFSSMKAQE